MYIIDKHKDFYDYISHIYGEDKKVTFDRRGSTLVNDEQICDTSNEYLYPANELFTLLEIGNIQYLIRINNLKFKKDFNDIEQFVSCKMEIVKIFKDNKHYFDTPLSIRGVRLKSHWSWRLSKEFYSFDRPYSELISKTLKNPIDNPVLKETQLTSLLDPQEVWIELQNYISSLNNEKDIDLKMNDVEKAEIHGFDKKTSFRNPIK